MGVRSVSECASVCYQNNTCRSAIYRASGECTLFTKMSSDLDPTRSDSATDKEFIAFPRLVQSDHVSVSLSKVNNFIWYKKSNCPLLINISAIGAEIIHVMHNTPATKDILSWIRESRSKVALSVIYRIFCMSRTRKS